MSSLAKVVKVSITTHIILLSCAVLIGIWLYWQQTYLLGGLEKGAERRDGVDDEAG